MGFFEKLKAGLSKTKKALFGGIEDLFKRFRRVDEDLFDELEELLITSDVGVETTEELLDALREKVKEEKIKEPEEIKKILYAELRSMIGEGSTCRPNPRSFWSSASTASVRPPRSARWLRN